MYQATGGWAVDALVGSQSRTHGDLDLFVDAGQVDTLIEWLSGRGYEVVEDWRPIRAELRSGDRAVDIHPMTLDAAGDGVQKGFGDETFAYRASDRVEGMIRGRPVARLRFEMLIRCTMTTSVDLEACQKSRSRSLRTRN